MKKAIVQIPSDTVVRLPAFYHFHRNEPILKVTVSLGLDACTLRSTKLCQVCNYSSMLTV